MPSSVPNEVASPGAPVPPPTAPTGAAFRLLHLADSLLQLGGWWRFAAAGIRTDHGPSEALLFDQRSPDMDCLGYDLLGSLGACRYGDEPQHVINFEPGPLIAGLCTWNPFRDAEETSRQNAEMAAEAKRFESVWPIRTAPDAGEPETNHTEPEPEAAPVCEFEDNEPPEPSPRLVDYFLERVQAAAALVPDSRINTVVGPVVKEWFRRRFDDPQYRGWLSVYSDWLAKHHDRELGLDWLASSYLASESKGTRLLVLLYAELRGTEHVREYPTPSERTDADGCGWDPSDNGPRGRHSEDPVAVIQWPCDALIELLKRLALEARDWGERAPFPESVGERSITPPPQKIRRRNTLDAEMRTLLEEEPKSRLWWSADMWSKRLGCSKSTIAELKTWKYILATREAVRRREQRRLTEETR